MNYFSILAVADEDILTSESVDAPLEAVTSTTQDGSPTAPAGETPAGRTSPGYYNMIFIGVMIVIMYFFVLRGPKKKQQKHQKMVQSLQKNDRVRTIGGIFGTVLEVKDDFIILKIDESNNTKMKISPTAIGTVISDDKD
ncbi:MAG: preprotein translocase subunit YajC [Planctomycetes bacterium]|nr:preprotein translocase subunit YajC [Planctomycetota bacterium]